MAIAQNFNCFTYVAQTLFVQEDTMFIVDWMLQFIFSPSHNNFTLLFLILVICAILTQIIKPLGAIAEHGKFVSAGSGSKVLKSDIFYVPKQYFLHFYVVGLAISLVSYLLLIKYPLEIVSLETSKSAITLMMIHCTQRLFECAFLTRYGQSKIHIAGYLVGILHYIAVPLSIISTPVYLFAIPSMLSFQPFVKVSFFCLSLLQMNAHYTLYRLKTKAQIINERKSTDLGNGMLRVVSKCYAFPSGYLFDCVCCPHYLLEICLYVLMFLSRPSVTQLAVFLWVTTNLMVVAQNQYAWYSATFPEEMKTRRLRRLIPYVW